MFLMNGCWWTVSPSQLMQISTALVRPITCHSFPLEDILNIYFGNTIPKKLILFISGLLCNPQGVGKSSSVPLEKLWISDGEDVSGETSITILIWKHPETKPKGSFSCCSDCQWHFSSIIHRKGKCEMFLYFAAILKYNNAYFPGGLQGKGIDLS